MNDALTPLRQAYGLEPGSAAPGSPERAEQELLRGARAALDAAPARRPSDAALSAVRERAAQASAEHARDLDAVRSVYGEGDRVESSEAVLLDQTREAVDRLFAARPQPRPDARVLDAVRARAAEAVAEPVRTDRPALAPLVVALGGAGAPSVESETLAQSLDALGRLPRPAPSADAVGAVLAFAATASADGLGAVRYVYEGGERPDAPVEVALLEQTRHAVERALVARPQPRPEASAVDAVLARAADATAARADEPTVSDPALAPLALAYGLPLSAPSASGGVEGALLAQTSDALSRLRPARPDAAAVQNVLARAASARRPAGAARPARADRAAAPSGRRLPGPVWVSAATLLLAALTGVGVLFNLYGPDGSPATGPVEVATTETPAVPEIATVGVAAEPDAARPAADPSAVPEPVAAVQAAPAPSARLVAARQPVAPPSAARTAPPPPETPTPAWEVGEDVRALSLRLEELDRSIEGLAWDEPAEVFGRPAEPSALTSTPGVRAVRAGAAPARARITPADSSRTPR